MSLLRHGALMNFLIKMRNITEATNIREKITNIGSKERKAILSATKELPHSKVAVTRHSNAANLGAELDKSYFF